jgi:glycogen synthase
MITWEYPPLVIGGIAAHAEGLSRALVRAGHDVVVLTLHHPDAPDDAVIDGVRVLRAHADLPWLPDHDFLARMASANHKLVQLTARLPRVWRPDVIHAHDWLAAWAGDTLRALWGVPLVATVHATERGRQGGTVPPGQPSGISAVEWWLTYQARHVIACSDYMVDEVVDTFATPRDKVTMVPNGVDAHLWAPPTPPPVRGEGGPLVVTWGRIQHEKGFHTLIEALPLVRTRVPDVRVVVAGRGSHLPALQDMAHRMGVADCVDFAGFVPDDELRDLLHRASCAVIPSLYEPFGIVALEALAAGAPLVAAAAGGLTEVLSGSDAGLLFEPGKAPALAEALVHMLTEPGRAAASQLAGAALLRERYSWDVIATATLPVYERVLADPEPEPEPEPAADPAPVTAPPPSGDPAQLVEHEAQGGQPGA